MIYVLIPHAAKNWMHVRMFNTYAAAEFTALTVARALRAEGRDTDWCEIVAYEGLDEVTPRFVYALVGAERLHREDWPTPSS